MKYAHGKHPNSIKNLKPYKPGENGHGRVYPLKERLAHALDKPLKKPTEDACAGDLLVYSSLQGAIKREATPFIQVWDRIEGKVREEHAIVGDIVIEVVYRDKRNGDADKDEDSG